MPPRLTNKDNLPPTRRACGRCGTLGHLARTCQRPEKRHDKIGVEIEGYWRRQPAEPKGPLADTFALVEGRASNWHMDGTSDGSLATHDGYRAWEFRSRPGSLGEAISQVLAVYPHATDASVGMHVHVSFSKEDVMLLASDEFLAYFYAHWHAWGQKMEIHPSSEFWPRLRGENRYCQLATSAKELWHGVCRCGVRWCRPDDTACAEYKATTSATSVTQQHSRYYAINFQSHSAHGTVECRLLPCFKSARLAIAAMEHLIWIYESFLAERSEAILAAAARKVTMPAASVSGPTVRSVALPALPAALPAAWTVETRRVAIPNLPASGTVVPRPRLVSYLTSIGAL